TLNDRTGIERERVLNSLDVKGRGIGDRVKQILDGRGIEIKEMIEELNIYDKKREEILRSNDMSENEKNIALISVDNEAISEGQVPPSLERNFQNFLETPQGQLVGYTILTYFIGFLRNLEIQNFLQQLEQERTRAGGEQQGLISDVIDSEESGVLIRRDRIIPYTESGDLASTYRTLDGQEVSLAEIQSLITSLNKLWENINMQRSELDAQMKLAIVLKTIISVYGTVSLVVLSEVMKNITQYAAFSLIINSYLDAMKKEQDIKLQIRDEEQIEETERAREEAAKVSQEGIQQLERNKQKYRVSPSKKPQSITAKSLTKNEHINYLYGRGIDTAGYDVLMKYFEGIENANTQRLEQIAANFRDSEEYRWLRYRAFAEIDNQKEAIRAGLKTVQYILGRKTFSILEAFVLGDMIFDIMNEDKGWHLRGVQLATIIGHLQGKAVEAGTAAGKTAVLAETGMIDKLLMGDNFDGVLLVENESAIDKFMADSEGNKKLLETVGLKFFDVDRNKNNEVFLTSAFSDSNIYLIVSHSQWGHLYNGSYSLKKMAESRSSIYIDEAHKVTKENISYVMSGQNEMYARYNAAKYVHKRVTSNLYKRSGEKEHFSRIETEEEYNAAISSSKRFNIRRLLAVILIFGSVILIPIFLVPSIRKWAFSSFREINVIFIFTNKKLIDLANRDEILGVFEEEGINQSGMIFSNRLQKEYSYRTFSGKIKKFLTTFSTKNTDLSSQLREEISALLYEEKDKTFDIVKLSEEELKNNPGKKYKISPKKDGVTQYDQQLGSVEKVLALSLLGGIDPKEVVMPKQSGKSISRGEVFNVFDKDGKRIKNITALSGTLDGQVEKSLFGTQVLRLGKVTNADYNSTIGLVEANEEDGIIEVPTEENFAIARDKIGKDVIIAQVEVKGENRDKRRETMAEKIANNIVHQYINTGTANLAIIEDRMLRDRVLVLAQKGLEKYISSENYEERRRAQFLLKQFQNREARIKSKNGAGYITNEALNAQYDAFVEAQNEAIKLGLIDKEYQNYLEKNKEKYLLPYYYQLMQDLEKERQNGVDVSVEINEIKKDIIDRTLDERLLLQLEIDGEVAGEDRLYNVSRYMSLMMGLVIVDERGATGTDYKQTRDFGINLNLADIDTLSDEATNQRRGRVVRSFGSRSLITEYFDSVRLKDRLFNDLHLSLAGWADRDFEEELKNNMHMQAIKRNFETQKRDDLIQLLKEYANGTISTSNLILLKINIAAAKSTSEALINNFSEKLRDKYLIEKFKSTIEELRRPYASVGQIRKIGTRINSITGEREIAEEIYDKSGKLIKTIIWEDANNTLGRIEEAGQADIYIRFDEKTGILTEYKSKNGRDSRTNEIRTISYKEEIDTANRLEIILKDELLTKNSGYSDNELSDIPYSAEERIQNTYNRISDEADRVIMRSLRGVLSEENSIYLDMKSSFEEMKKSTELKTGQVINEEVLKEFGEVLKDNVLLKDIKDDEISTIRNNVQIVQKTQRDQQFVVKTNSEVVRQNDINRYGATYTMAIAEARNKDFAEIRTQNVSTSFGIRRQIAT
ncbi:MAG: hypothetical protein LBF97_05550, partial [Elusimicrobiota bacterium]|nr:hypothetical protein [Elusimicrobiota bacterium]